MDTQGITSLMLSESDSGSNWYGSIDTIIYIWPEHMQLCP